MFLLLLFGGGAVDREEEEEGAMAPGGGVPAMGAIGNVPLVDALEDDLSLDAI